MGDICAVVYNYLIAVYNKIFNSNENKEDIISIDQEWENILREEEEL